MRLRVLGSGDAFASGGLYVPKAWASATLTAPSHATILTGLQPYRHGVRDNHGEQCEVDASPSIPGAIAVDVLNRGNW